MSNPLIALFLLAVMSLHGSTMAFGQDESWKAALGNPAETAADLREEIIRFPLLDAPLPAPELIGTIYRPRGAGPFPVIVLSHGSPTNPADRVVMGRYRLLAQIRALITEGFAVLAPMRRGYGQSQESVAESFGRCPQARFDLAGTESARDISSAIAWLRSQSDLDGNRIILMGQSAGGFASLAASSESIPGIVATINLSGGRGGNGATGIPCNVTAMTDLMAQYGGKTRVPALWFYVENDKYFGPETAATWFKAWQGAGGTGKLLINPTHGNDGHLLFYAPDGLPIWLGAIRDFLKSTGFAYPLQAK
jgi:dienelactone hydrolase